MQSRPNELCVRLAKTADDLLAVQALRYQVFIKELGGDGTDVDHALQVEADRFDPFCDHLMLEDTAGRLVGVYRLMTQQMAARAGGFYSDAEFDLTALMTCGKPILELGRSCLHMDYRGGAGMLRLWSGVAEYVARHKIEIMFGVASFHGTDVGAIAGPLSLLDAAHRSQDFFCPARASGAVPMNIMTPETLDRKSAILAMPSLIKAYLRLGGAVGQGAFVDHRFNTTDVLMIVNIAKMDPQTRAAYRADGVTI